MADDTKNLQKIITEAIRPLKDIVEIVKHKVDRMETGKEAQFTSFYLMREQQSVMNEKLDTISKDLERLEGKTDALSGDIEQLHDDVKAIKDKTGMYHDRNKREIDEIKTHLHLPLISDIPQV